MQGALSVANGPGGTVRANFNAAIARLATRASGTGRPSDIATGEEWIETDNPGTGVWSQWQYDGSNDILVRLINSTAHTIQPGSVTTTKGDLIKRGTSADARFAVGTSHFLLGTNSAGDDLEWKRPGWIRLAADQTPASAATVDFTSIPSTCKALMVAYDLLPATNSNSLSMRVSQGGSFVTGSSYQSAFNSTASDGTQAIGGSTSATSANIAGGGVANSAGNGATGMIFFPNIQSAGNVHWTANAGFSDGAKLLQQTHMGRCIVNGAIDGIRLFFASGNIASGRIALLGLMA